MNLDKILEELVCRWDRIGGFGNEIDKAEKRLLKQAKAGILDLIKKKMPKKENKYNECNTQYCLGYDTGWNAHRKKALKNLGIKESKNG